MVYIIELKKRVEIEAETSRDAVEYAVGAEEDIPLWQIEVRPKNAKAAGGKD